MVMMLLSTITHAQVQNLDFESWEASINRPTGWECGYYYNSDPFTNFYFPPETNAQNNNFALKICLWYMYVEDMAIQKAPINYKPTSLQGYYKYEHNLIYDSNDNIVTDTATVSVYLTKWNPTTVQRDTIGSGILELGEEKLAYTPFTNPITYVNTQMPDSITMVFEPSKFPAYYLPGLTADQTSTSFFTIDNLMLTQQPLKTDEVLKNEIKIYPNPANKQLSIANFTGVITIYDSTGKLVLKAEDITPIHNKIKTSDLTAGIYTIQLTQGNNNIYRKFIKQ